MWGTRLKTKDDRLSVQTSIFTSLINNGWKQETYKGWNIFTKDEGEKFYIKTYKGTSTNATDNYWCRSADRRTERIKERKESIDRHETWKKEQKAKPTTAAGASASIKQELKKLYPGFKFSVTSENYSGGSSVRTKYILGPDEDEVEALVTAKYQYGKFNSQEDLYEISNSRDDIPQAKYQFTSQDMPEELLYRMAKLLSDTMKFGDVPPLEGREQLHSSFPCLYGSAWTWAELTRQKFRKRNFVTQDESKINLLSVHRGEDYDSIYFIYEVDGKQYSTEESVRMIAKHESLPAVTKPAEVAEVPEDEIQVIDYSERSIAVIGKKTIQIKDKLKALGGAFNSRLTCGPGWIFPKTKLEALKEALTY